MRREGTSTAKRPRRISDTVRSRRRRWPEGGGGVISAVWLYPVSRPRNACYLTVTARSPRTGIVNRDRVFGIQPGMVVRDEGTKDHTTDNDLSINTLRPRQGPKYKLNSRPYRSPRIMRYVFVFKLDTHHPLFPCNFLSVTSNSAGFYRYGICIG